MRSPRIVLIVAGLWLSVGLISMAAAAEVSKEAQECYDWFATLGFPDVQDAPWALVWTGNYHGRDGDAAHFSPVCHQGFIVETKATGFRLLGPDLTESVYENGRADEPDYARIRFEPRSFHEVVRDFPARLQERYDGRRDHSQGSVALGQKAQFFFLSYVCWRRGEKELAQGIFDGIGRMPGALDKESRLIVRPLREDLEADIGAVETWDAVLRLGGGSMGENRWGVAGSGGLVSRAALLERFRQIVRLYPANEYRESAEKIAAMLERMVAEDAAHPQLTPEEIAKLPPEKQAAEWIFQLRDQSGHQSSLFRQQGDRRGECDIFDTRPERDSPAQHLLALRLPAVPLLIEALDDPRFSRSVRFQPDFRFSPQTIVTIGDCAQQILIRMFGVTTYPPGGTWPNQSEPGVTKKAALEWWAEFQKKGSTVTKER